MKQTIAALTLLVREYDEAIEFFTRALGFTLIEDSPLDNGKRWVVVAPAGAAGARLLLGRAANPQQQASVGNQGGGWVFLFLHTDNFSASYAHMQAQGVKFTEEPRTEAYGRVVVFLDLYGNKWDLVQAVCRLRTAKTPACLRESVRLNTELSRSGFCCTGSATRCGRFNRRGCQQLLAEA